VGRFPATSGFSPSLCQEVWYSRTTFVIGFVLGAPLERQFLLTQRLYGWSFIERPGVQLILAIFAISIAIPLVRRILRRGRGATALPAASRQHEEVE